MKNHMIKIGTAVPKLKVGNIPYNVEQIKECIANSDTSSILVFPELCITGYTCADLFHQQLLLDQAKQGLFNLKNYSRQFEGLLISVGFPLQFQNHVYNCAAYINDGEIIGIVPKIFIPNYNEFYEYRWFTSGKDIVNQFVELDGQKIPFGWDLLIEDDKSLAVVGTEICEDLWVADKPSTHLALAGANIILNLSASDELIGKQEYRKQLVNQQAASTYSAYAYVSSGTDESSTDLVFSGHSLISDCGTTLLDTIFSEKNRVHYALIDLDKLIYNRYHSTTYMPLQTMEYRHIQGHIKPVGHAYDLSVNEAIQAYTKQMYFVPASPFVPTDEAERGKRCLTILNIQAQGLATRVRSTGIHNLVIGVSGGLDSTLAMLVCKEAQKIEPSIRIIAYTMPNHGNTTSLTYNNAVSLMKLLGADCREVAIENGVKLHLEELGRDASYLGEGDVTYENAQARYRTYILMDAANMENGLVVGTGDLSELALGWCTYNGDHMSMYAVNASIPKTLVQYICRTYANEIADEELKKVLLSICDTPISPELTPNKDGEIAQKTEDKIGKYDLNDFFLFYTLRYGFTPSKLITYACLAYPSESKDFIKDALKRFYNRFFHQQFKRSCLPDGPKVGSVTLSPRGDWRMPSDANVEMWINEVDQA